MTLRVWEIDGEDFIVAKSEREMRKVYVDFHGGDSIRGHHRRIVPPDEKLEFLSDDGDGVEFITARKLSRSYEQIAGRGHRDFYIPAGN